MRLVLWAFALAIAAACGAAVPGSGTFRFIILGDRTGAEQPGVYSAIWNEAAGLDPAFVVSVGDTIEGDHDSTAETEWEQAEVVRAPYAKLPLYLAPGNHDIWSPGSEKLFRRFAGHPPHYSFDYGSAHFTILDNSRTDELTPSELTFLEQDLEAHASQPVKFIIAHRPSWLVKTLLGESDFPLHQLARKYGVQYVVAGHLHAMLHQTVDGINYVSMPSSGGKLRGAAHARDGSFFGYGEVEVGPDKTNFRIHELGGPVTNLTEWGPGGLARP